MHESETTPILSSRALNTPPVLSPLCDILPFHSALSMLITTQGEKTLHSSKFGEREIDPRKQFMSRSNRASLVLGQKIRKYLKLFLMWSLDNAEKAALYNFQSFL